MSEVDADWLPSYEMSFESDSERMASPPTYTTSPDILEPPPRPQKWSNIVKKLTDRQIYGRCCKHTNAKTEKLFDKVPERLKFQLDSILPDFSSMRHIHMGFSLCGQYFISLCKETTVALEYVYDLYFWRFAPMQRLKFVSKHRVFKQHRTHERLVDIMFVHFPNDSTKILCYGRANSTQPPMAFLSIVTLPFPKSCKHCYRNFPTGGYVNAGWCSAHGFTLHYMFPLTQPAPKFNPNISLAYPDHIVLHTGDYVHIINVTTLDPPVKNAPTPEYARAVPFNDTMSEVSESLSEHFGTRSIVDKILEDFSESDLENNDTKPFHELNISCEPLNVTGKTCHNTLVPNIADPRLKQRYAGGGIEGGSTVKSSVADKKSAEKAYEFTEETEKCEKLSSFRKKRLAEKRYEFSEDNSENVIPFNWVRSGRRFFYRANRFTIRSPEFNGFRSPRSPILNSPGSRQGPFSPGRSVHHFPYHSRSPAAVSPRESMTKKFYVLIPVYGAPMQRVPLIFERHQSNDLLTIDPRCEKSKWIKKVVRRYSNVDFETSSLLSGQSRDEYNIPIEIPVLVNNLNEQHLDVVPDNGVDQLTEMQLILTQRTFDCEAFIQMRAQKVCSDLCLKFLFCEDYDIAFVYICPINGHILFKAVIRLGALKDVSCMPKLYTTQCLFTWNIVNDSFDVMEPTDDMKLQGSTGYRRLILSDIPPANFYRVHVMDFRISQPKLRLRDYNNLYEVWLNLQYESSESEDSDY